jgi:hypothetical protein
VELGKQMATELLDPLIDGQQAYDFDSSTNGLLGAIRDKRDVES